ncbi:hypothetical protein UlMin_018693 [Ulmus minor]
MAELLGTYFFIFTGCAAISVNIDKNVITFPGIAVVWGLTLMVMIYSLGHISGAHLNPVVTIAFATIKKFQWKEVPAYGLVQVVGATLANGTVRLLFNGKHDHFVGNSPTGTDLQAFVVEFIITFYLMFVICGVATDNRAIGELAGLAIGATILLNMLFAGPISSASMNPARSLGSAIVWNKYEGIWIYIVAPIVGGVIGAWAYTLVRFTPKPVREITQSGSFLKGLGRNNSN